MPSHTHPVFDSPPQRHPVATRLCLVSNAGRPPSAGSGPSPGKVRVKEDLTVSGACHIPNFSGCSPCAGGGIGHVILGSPGPSGGTGEGSFCWGSRLQAGHRIAPATRVLAVSGNSQIPSQSRGRDAVGVSRRRGPVQHVVLALPALLGFPVALRSRPNYRHI